MTTDSSNVSRYGAIAALFLAYALSGSVISSMGQKIVAAVAQNELILPLISKMVMGVAGTGMIFTGSLVLAGLVVAVLILLARSENHCGRFLTALTIAWMILLGGVLFALLGFALPVINVLD